MRPRFSFAPESAIVAVLALVSLAPFAPPAFDDGDAAVYVQQAEQASLTERSVHIGYIAMLCGFFGVLGGAASDQQVNLLATCFGAATVALGYSFARGHGGRLAGLATALLLATNSLVVAHSVFAEVYIVQTFLLLSAALAIERRLTVAAGLLLAFAFLVTPSSILLVPGLLILAPSWRFVLAAGGIASTLVLIVVAPVARTFLFGGRGLLSGVEASFDPGGALAKEGGEVVFGFLFLLPVLVLGFVTSMRRGGPWRLGAATAVCWLPTLVLGERYGDVPVQLPTYALAAVAAGTALFRASRSPSDTEKGHGPLSDWRIQLGCLLTAFYAPAAIWFVQRRLHKLEAIPATFTAAATGLLALGILLVIATHLGRRRGASLGASRIPWPRQGLLVVLLLLAALNATQSGLRVADRARAALDFRHEALALWERADPDSLVVGGWGRGILFEHYVFRESYTGHWLDSRSLVGIPDDGQALKSRRLFEQALETGREIWLLENDETILAELESHDFRITPVGSFFQARRPANGSEVSGRTHKQ